MVPRELLDRMLKYAILQDDYFQSRKNIKLIDTSISIQNYEHDKCGYNLKIYTNN